MDHSLLTEQQLQKRYYSLSQKIRDVLDSENNLKIIHQICRAHQLNDDEKILIIEQLVGLILLGFVSADDLSLEISENIHLNHRHSDDVAFEINRKIFAPIWSEIEKNYSPISEGETEAGEVKPTTDDLQLTTDNQQEMGDKSEQISIPIPTFSRDSEADALVGSPIDRRSQSIGVEIRKPEPPIKIIGMEEEENHRITNQDEYTNKDKEVKESALGEGPMIIHKETEFKPLSESKKSFKSLGGLFGFLSASRRKKEKPEEAKPVKAEIEGAGFSKEIPAKGGPAVGWKEIIKEFKPIETKIKVVDYTEVPEKSPNNESARIYESKDENHQITNQNEYTNKNNEGRNVANEIEPPIRIIDDLQPTTKIKLPKIEAPESPLVVSGAESFAELPSDGQVIISQETEQKPKKKFFSKLSGFFKKKN